MKRVAIFSETALRRVLKGSGGKGLALDFLKATAWKKKSGLADLDCDAALLEITTRTGAAGITALRGALPGRPVGSISRRNDARLVGRSVKLGFDFHLGAWKTGNPVAGEILARVGAAAKAHATDPLDDPAHTSAEKLGILADIVKTANSILEPKKVIELVMSKIQVLVPSEAWSLLLVDEGRSQLVFEAALGAQGEEISSARLALGEGVAGWVAKHGKPAIINDVRKDKRFSARFDKKSSFQTRSMLCAPLVARGRIIGVVQVLNRAGGDFTRGDLNMLMMLVEPAAIAIENAFLFQKAEQLTVTDDLTKLFNSRYLNIYLAREISRCKRHGTSLALLFMDLDGFKGINDIHGHLASSATLTEVGGILAEAVRDSDIVARYGGDEFVVVLPETPLQGALIIAERIRHSIEQRDFLKEMGIHARLSGSFGVACYPDHAQTPEALVQKADQAMYRVKGRNKNAVEVAS